jgi:hypothetical protein
MMAGHCSYNTLIKPQELNQDRFCTKSNATQLDEISDTKDNPNAANVNYVTTFYSSTVWLVLLALF